MEVGCVDFGLKLKPSRPIPQVWRTFVATILGKGLNIQAVYVNSRTRSKSHSVSNME